MFLTFSFSELFQSIATCSIDLICFMNNFLVQFIIKHSLNRLKIKKWILRWFKLKRSGLKKSTEFNYFSVINKITSYKYLVKHLETYLEIYELMLCTEKPPKNIRLEWAVSLLFGSYEVNPPPPPKKK